LRVHFAQAFAYLAHEPAVLHEGVVGAGGYGEAAGNGRAHARGQFPQVGALATHPVHHVAVDVGEGQGVGLHRGLRTAFQQFGDFTVDAFHDGGQRRVRIVGDGVEPGDHAHGVEHGAGGLRAQPGGPEQGAPRDLFVNVGKDARQFGVGVQQVLEMGVAGAEHAHDPLARFGIHGTSTAAEQ